MDLGVLLPEELQRDAVALQLTVDVRALGSNPLVHRCGAGVKPLALIKQASANRSRAAGRKALINQDLCNRLENVDPPYEKFLWYGTW